MPTGYREVKMECVRALYDRSPYFISDGESLKIAKLTQAAQQNAARGRIASTDLRKISKLLKQLESAIATGQIDADPSAAHRLLELRIRTTKISRQTLHQ